MSKSIIPRNSDPSSPTYRPAYRPTWRPPVKKTTPRDRTRLRICTECGADLATANYYSFDSKRLWCIPCGEVHLAETIAGLRAGGLR